MPADIDIARQISELMLDVSKQVDASVALIQGSCSPEEAANYRRALGRVLGEILLEILNPIYLEHPSLKPAGME